MAIIVGDFTKFAPLLGNVTKVLSLNETDEIQQDFTAANLAACKSADELLADGSDARLRRAAHEIRAQLDCNVVACKITEQIVCRIEFELALRATRRELAEKEAKAEAEHKE